MRSLLLILLLASRQEQLSRGQQLLWAKRFDEAARVFRALGPNDVDARRGLAFAEYWSGDFRGAQRDFAFVASRRPNDAEVARALRELAAASVPVVAGESEHTADDQPLRRTLVSASYGWFSDPLTKWSAGAGTYRLSGGHAAPFASLGGETVLPRSKLRPSATIRWMRFPDGTTEPLGNLTLARGRFTASIDKHELLYTLGSLTSHPSATEASIAWRRGDDTAASVRTIRYFDRNQGRAADAWHLARVAGPLHLGLAASWRDTDQSRLAGNRYDPYWTPQDLVEIRAVAAAAMPIPRATLRLHADGGLAHDRELGVPRTFHPWRASADVDVPLRGMFHLTAGFEHQSTVFYRADSFRIGFSGRP